MAGSRQIDDREASMAKLNVIIALGARVIRPAVRQLGHKPVRQ